MIKYFLSYASFNSIAAGLNFVTILFMSRVLSPEEYGYIGILQALLFFLVPAITFASADLIMIKKVGLDTVEYHNFISQYLSLSILVSVLLFPIFVFVYIYGFEAWGSMILFLPFICLLQSIARVHTIELIQERNIKLFGLYRVATSVLLISLTVFFLLLLEMSWEGRVFSIVLAELALFIIRYKISFSSLRKLDFLVTKAFLKDIYRFGLPLFILLFASWGINEGDRFIVLGMLSLSDVGLYSLAYGIGSALNVVNTSMTNAIVPSVYGVMKNGRGKKTLIKISTYGSLSILFLSFLIAILIYYFGEFLVTEEYKKGIFLACLITVAFGVNGMYRTVSLPLVYLKLNKLKAQNIYIAAIVNLSLSVLLTSEIGLLGPAYGTLISFILLYFLTLYYNLKHTEHIKP
tara:strand:- start:8282 stop:9499 length:1218 start_codon:yes stop_codon:yes gene_type:complete